MESLESKLDRLSPDQRREIEEFVDFLLSRSGPVPASGNPLLVLNMTPPPLIPVEPGRVEETRAVMAYDLARADDRAAPGSGDEPGTARFQEIGNGVQDRITHDYIDYGQFEHSPSPATEAGKKVRRKIIARDEQEKPHHLLDWVD